MSHDTISDNHHRAGLRLKSEIAGTMARLALSQLTASLRDRRPDHASDAMADPLLPKHWRRQPRVPAGSPDGGQWTSGGGGGGARVERVSRTPRRNNPQNRGAAPRNQIVMHQGRRIEVTRQEYIAYHSSARRANMLTDLVRRYDPNWRPNPSISQGLPGAIRDQQYRGDQALQRLQELRPVFLREQNINHILYPLGRPVGYVYGTRDANIRTVNRSQFTQLLAQLTRGARRIDSQMGRGEVYLRPDGVTVNVRYSRGSNGLTLDIGWPGGAAGRIHKVHFQSRIDWKGFELMQKNQLFPEYSDIQHELIQHHAVQDVRFSNITKMIFDDSMNFGQYIRMKLGDWEGGFPNDIHHLNHDLATNFGFEGEELNQAKLYLLTVLIGHGMVPMTYGYGDYEYDPEYAYGETPQEIIDNLHADWCARELDTPDMPALMLGWERECGGFYPDEEGEAEAG